MEVKLENLIEKLRQEGVEEAQRASEQILSDSKKKADAIIKEARKKADTIVADADKKAKSFQENSERVVEQAVRDSVLLLKNNLSDLFDSVFKEAVSGVMDEKFLKDMILKLVEKWSEGKDLEIGLNKNDIKKLEDVLFAGTGEKLKNGITLIPDRDLEAGFRISVKGDDLYYDFSDESVGEILKKFLSPKIQEILEGKNG
ncbi:DivIVA domain-containing protein [bacterium]|nr:DivIVA domain-containing protein [bacterium]